MLEILLYYLTFFLVPVSFVVAISVSIYRYVSAKRKNKEVPGTFPDYEIKKRMLIMITLLVIAAVLACVVIGFICLLYMAVAYM